MGLQHAVRNTQCVQLQYAAGRQKGLRGQLQNAVPLWIKRAVETVCARLVRFVWPLAYCEFCARLSIASMTDGCPGMESGGQTGGRQYHFLLLVLQTS